MFFFHQQNSTILSKIQLLLIVLAYEAFALPILMFHLRKFVKLVIIQLFGTIILC